MMKCALIYKVIVTKINERDLKFNRQRKRTDKPMKQGSVSTDFKEIQECCKDMCQRKCEMLADTKINNRYKGGLGKSAFCV